MQEPAEIILFDGVCNFCNSSVQFIIRKERKPELKFASLQSATGKFLLEKYKLDAKSLDTLVYIQNGKAYTRSSGALRITKKFKGLWPLLFGFIVVPPFIRNWVYNWVAKNRYKWWGKSDSCQIPTPALKIRFIDL
ncbi:MAG: DUF393 domain-containing protein [Bacteroidia bacterium]|nr:DUF393 domain-containing protein [Bacteroidia bacterium]